MAHNGARTSSRGRDGTLAAHGKAAGRLAAPARPLKRNCAAAFSETDHGVRAIPQARAAAIPRHKRDRREVFAITPIGYRAGDNGKLVEFLGEQQIVRELIALRSQGLSLHRIAGT